jgi:hypothetical protein
MIVNLLGARALDTGANNKRESQTREKAIGSMAFPQLAELLEAV